MVFEPAYRKLNDFQLKYKLQLAEDLQKQCVLCPRECKAERKKGEIGACKASSELKIASYGPHFGEEKPLVGFRGSGTIFFSYCNLECVFCQNNDISWNGYGETISTKELGDIMIWLEKKGCHNINLVTPTHFVPQIIKALLYAKEKGLKLPLVYNCGGYEAVQTLKVLEGVIDIYMPDFKYSDAEIAQKYSSIEGYPVQAKEALKEMHRQVGDLKLDKNNIALRGLIIRHLVLPENLAGTKEIMKFIAGELSKETYVNVMKQYHPANKSGRYPPIDRVITGGEYKKAVKAAEEAGLTFHE